MVVNGQAPGEDDRDLAEGTGLHGPYVVDGKAYLAYGAAGLVILDLDKPQAPREIGRLPLHPPFNAVIAAHTAVAIPDRDLLIVNSEAIEENCQEPLNFAGLVDVSDVANPTVQ